jgi:hypothetical protein
MNRLVLGFILIAVSWSAAAADTALYKVELIVFENLDPAALQAEQWPDNPAPPPLDNAIGLNQLTAAAAAASAAAAPPTPAAASTMAPGSPGAKPATAPPIPSPLWRWLKPSEFGLNGAENKLTSSGRYRPLLHIGWVQPLDSSDQGIPVHIYDGMAPREETPAQDAAPPPPGTQPPVAGASQPQIPGNPTVPALPEPAVTANSASDATPPGTSTAAMPATEQTAPPQDAEPLHVVDGTFTLRRERFLHADVDLGYRKTDIAPGTPPSGGTVQPAPLYVRMTQSRRLRTDELQYLDHPLFGVLFVVSPYNQKPAGDETE